MEVQIHSIHFDADDKLISFIQNKIDKLSQFHDQIVQSEVYLRLESSSTLENKVAEIRIRIPGKKLFAKRQCRSIEEATDMAVIALTRQIQKHKNKRRRVLSNL